MSGVYEADFEVIHVPFDKAPVANETAAPVGRHLDGCRIGFDAGGSDRKVSSVVEGEATYSEEVVWFPKLQNDPQYHYEGILDAMQTAASKMPSVDGIGVSTAGVVVGNRIMASSLFLKVKNENPEAFEKVVKNIYIDIAKTFGDVPVEVANDGDITALANIDDLRTQFPGLEAVMLGRGLVADPGMLSGSTEKGALQAFMAELLERYLEAFGGSRNAMFRLKENWHMLIGQFEGSEKLWKRLRKTTDLEEYKAITHEIFVTLPLKLNAR
jgi:hypothetical protein